MLGSAADRRIHDQPSVSSAASTCGASWQQINAMDAKDLEEPVLSVMKSELQTVVKLRAVIGAFLGAVNIFI